MFCPNCWQEFDSFATRQHLEQQTFRGAAASAVNVHPLARTFEGLVPVSLDAPPLRPKRKGKQVDTWRRWPITVNNVVVVLLEVVAFFLLLVILVL